MKRHDALLKGDLSQIAVSISQLKLQRKVKQDELDELNFIITCLETLQNSNKTSNFDSRLQRTENSKKQIPFNIQKILEENGALHYKTIYEKLTEIGINTNLNSIKALLHSYAKKQNKFLKVKENTFDLIKKKLPKYN